MIGNGLLQLLLGSLDRAFGLVLSTQYADLHLRLAVRERGHRQHDGDHRGSDKSAEDGVQKRDSALRGVQLGILELHDSQPLRRLTVTIFS